MKAMIFAAGMGTRLKPLTDTMPKALVSVAGKTLLQHTIEKLADAGFDEIVINAHHFSEQIIQFLQRHHNFGLSIRISDESGQLLDTGGGIRKAAPLLNDGSPFLVHNVDILSNANLKELYSHHLQTKGMATLLVNERNSSRYLLFDDQYRLQGWVNQLTGETKSPHPHFTPTAYHHFAFSGIQVISPGIFEWMKNIPDKFPIIDFYLSISAEVEINAFPVPCLKIIDVGKIESLKEAESFF